MKNKKTLGEIIKESRLEKGFSQRELAKLIKVDNALISRIENNSVTQPSYLILLKLSKELKLDVIDLMLYANYEPQDIMLLQNIQDLQMMAGVSPEKRKKYLKNGEINILQVISDYKVGKLNETEAISLFLETIGLEEITSFFIYHIKFNNKNS